VGDAGSSHVWGFLGRPGGSWAEAGRFSVGALSVGPDPSTYRMNISCAPTCAPHRPPPRVPNAALTVAFRGGAITGNGNWWWGLGVIGVPRYVPLLLCGSSPALWGPARAPATPSSAWPSAARSSRLFRAPSIGGIFQYQVGGRRARTCGQGGSVGIPEDDPRRTPRVMRRQRPGDNVRGDCARWLPLVYTPMYTLMLVDRWRTRPALLRFRS